ncbi:lysis protein [Atlantibacter sp.]|uniref:lysis protein n=1 Tax=Atlantibacter sp. TaxID=1903473 RepID=UPI0028A987F2|nr:lysis protein [Atlantibacter sp.]
MKSSRVMLLLLIELLLSVLLVWYLTGQIADEKGRADTAERNLKLANANINDMQVRQRDVAALDAKYTKELADAHENINQLERDVAAGRKRLQISARCPANGATSATSVDDGTTPGLTDAAERDYFTLRERIETSGKMIAGLQDYIKTQCLR